MANYLEFESMSEGMEDKVKQNLKFKTGNFVWKIKFNVPLDPKTVNNVNLYVTSLNLAPLKTAIRYNSLENEIEIEPMEAYAQNESYILNITTNVKSLNGKPLKKPIQVQFKIDRQAVTYFSCIWIKLKKKIKGKQFIDWTCFPFVLMMLGSKCLLTLASF